MLGCAGTGTRPAAAPVRTAGSAPGLPWLSEFLEGRPGLAICRLCLRRDPPWGWAQGHPLTAAEDRQDRGCLGQPWGSGTAFPQQLSEKTQLAGQKGRFWREGGCPCPQDLAQGWDRAGCPLSLPQEEGLLEGLCLYPGLPVTRRLSPSQAASPSLLEHFQTRPLLPRV